MLEIRGNLKSEYSDIYTKEALDAFERSRSSDRDRQALMKAPHRERRINSRRGHPPAHPTFLGCGPATIGATNIRWLMLRSELRRSQLPKEWQSPVDSEGTGPCSAAPNSSVEKSTRKRRVRPALGR
jgi:hypothetical protein